MKYLLLLVLFASCCGNSANSESSKFSMTCVEVSSNLEIFRCENLESVCYVDTEYKRGGISCKFKP